MLFYVCRLSYKCEKDSRIRNAIERTMKKNWGDEIIQDLNDTLAENSDKDKLEMVICAAKKDKFELVVATDSLERVTATNLMKKFTDRLDEYEFLEVKITSLEEITPEVASKLLRQADKNDYTSYRCSWERNGFADNEDFSLSYYDNRSFKIEEKLISDKKLSYKQALKSAEGLMVEKSFTDELERIYSDKNPKNFYGHPVHYKIVAKNSQGAIQMAALLCHALYANKRLVGRCMSFISEVTEDCYEECDIANIFRQSAGGTIIIELRGSREEHRNYASCYERVVKDFTSKVCKYQRDTLFIFIETTENPGFSPRFIKDLQEDIYIIELKEGAGSRAAAMEYLKKIIKQDKRIAYNEEDISAMFGEKTTFRPSDLQKIYEGLCRDNLRNNTYVTYKQASRLMLVKDDMSGKDAYKTLQEMIGLKDIKSIIDQIINNAKIQKTRSALGLDQHKSSMHMVFTGNPGSAKTTVARLLAEIMSKEGILESGEFIECGRADLVGEYVGQTAPKVKHQFRLARGGVLFIDEAYSLVEHWGGSYGDEAINTIVQEMENHRNDVIVIFAGYPDKMKNFLERNEGLRSRIAFHVDFPNYDENELLQILQLMAKNKGFELDSEIENKCREIFSTACKKADFGNGRFVRNLLEQALLKQSQRIYRENEGKEIGRKELLELKAEDFDVNVVAQYSDKSGAIGFRN